MMLNVIHKQRHYYRIKKVSHHSTDVIIKIIVTTHTHPLIGVVRNCSNDLINHILT